MVDHVHVEVTFAATCVITMRSPSKKKVYGGFRHRIIVCPGVPSLFRVSALSPEQLGTVATADTAPSFRQAFCHGSEDHSFAPILSAASWIYRRFNMFRHYQLCDHNPRVSSADRSISCSHTSCSQHAHRLSPTSHRTKSVICS
jgi:hypothetical protein